MTALRRALAGIATLAGDAEFGSTAAARAAQLAETVLQVDPSDSTLQHVAAGLGSAASAISAARNTEARALLDSAATSLAAAMRQGLPPAPGIHALLEMRRLEGELRTQSGGSGPRSR